MTRQTIFLLALCAAVAVYGQTGDANQPGSADQRHGKKNKDEITVRGCVGKMSTDYILTQPERGNSYELQGDRNIRLRRYLGRQVEVTGIEGPSMSTSSDVLTRSGSASPVTITVTSIKTIAQRCSD
jgi:hypothetical protein